MVYYVVEVLGTAFVRRVYISEAVSSYIPPDWTVSFNGVTLQTDATPWQLGMSNVYMNDLTLQTVDHSESDTDGSGYSSPRTSVGSDVSVWETGDAI